MRDKIFLILIKSILLFLFINSLFAQDDEMNLKHHTINGFINPWPGSEDRGMIDLLRWGVWDRIAGKKPETKDKYDFPVVENDGKFLRENINEFTVTWIGHSTFLIQLDGVNILTDPVWSDRSSPVQWAGPKRHARPGIDLEDLPEIFRICLNVLCDLWPGPYNTHITPQNIE